MLTRAAFLGTALRQASNPSSHWVPKGAVTLAGWGHHHQSYTLQPVQMSFQMGGPSVLNSATLLTSFKRVLFSMEEEPGGTHHERNTEQLLWLSLCYPQHNRFSSCTPRTWEAYKCTHTHTQPTAPHLWAELLSVQEGRKRAGAKLMVFSLHETITATDTD